MPLHEGPPNAVSQIYAKSLFELAEAKGGRGTIETCLSELEDILELARKNPRFGEFLASPTLAADDRETSLVKIFHGRLSELTLNFLRVLNDKGRLSQLPRIAAAFDSIAQERFGRVEVDVFTVAPLSAEESENIRGRLSRSLAKDVVLHPYVDANMIGGIKFRIGDQLVDASLATQVRNIQDQFDGNGLSQLRSRFDRILGD